MTAWIRAGAALALLTAALPAQALEIGERGQETGIEGSPDGPGFGVALGAAAHGFAVPRPEARSLCCCGRSGLAMGCSAAGRLYLRLAGLPAPG